MNSSSLKERPEILADFVIENRATVRSCAAYFGVSKSTVHKDLTVRLRALNPSLHSLVKAILDTNKSERHIRGGEATRRKYSDKKQKSKNNS